MGCGGSRAEATLDASTSFKDLNKQVTRSRKRGEEPPDAALKLLEGKSALAVALKVVPKELCEGPPSNLPGLPASRGTP